MRLTQNSEAVRVQVPNQASKLAVFCINGTVKAGYDLRTEGSCLMQLLTLEKKFALAKIRISQIGQK